MLSPARGRGIGLRAMRVTTSSEMASRTVMREVGGRDADEGDGQAADGGTDDGGSRPRRCRSRRRRA